MSEERRQFNVNMYEMLNKISGDLGEIKGSLDSLAGPQGRVTALEDDMKAQERRSWIQTAVVIPIVGALHLGAKKLGL